jgi:hypothetical protein
MTQELMGEASRQLIQELTHNNTVTGSILSENIDDSQKEELFQKYPKLKNVLLSINRLFQIYNDDVKTANENVQQESEKLKDDTRAKYSAMNHNKLAKDAKALEFAKRKLIEQGESEDALNDDHILYEKSR